jgi:hypothetical protein
MRLWLIGGAILGLALYLFSEKVYPASAVREIEEGEKAKFPQVTGKNLEGRGFNLPKDFEGEVNLCLIAFTQEQQYDVNTWLDNAKPFLEIKGFALYELPTLPESNPAFRYWLDSVMYQGIPDKRQRERTITLYLSKSAFRKSLNLPNEKTIYAILTDRSGNVLWQETGRFTPEKAESLRKALAQR